MEHSNDHRGNLNDYYQATIANEDRARKMLEEIARASRASIDREQLHMVAQCMVIAEWPEEQEIPLVVYNATIRHGLRRTMEMLRTLASNITRGKIRGHEQLVAEIAAMNRRCGAVLEQAKGSPEHSSRRTHE